MTGDSQPVSASEAEQNQRGGASTVPAEALDALNRIGAIAGDLGSERVAGAANDLAERLSEGRFYVACVGQFKRGKSTVIDAPIGEAIRPTGITPVTAVPTVLRFGERHAARVRFAHGEWKWIPHTELEQYVSEEHNPENAKEVGGVEVFVPSSLLASGMCLVDTPG